MINVVINKLILIGQKKTWLEKKFKFLFVREIEYDMTNFFFLIEISI